MADEIDQAQDQIEQQLAFAFVSRERERLVSRKRCYFCDEDIEAGLLFCSSDCRDDYDRERDARRRAGLKDR